MPLYTVKNDEQTKELFLSWEEFKEWLLDNPEWKEVLSVPKIVSGVGSNIAKTSDGYKDLLKNIKRNSGKHNTINT